MVSGDHSTIVKPRNDEREYKRVLLSNGLQVLLVSDPETDKGAAAMDVHVGSFNDPEGVQGLAHFLEHMLFYASEKYPEEGSYKKFLSEHGGYANAFTGDENTNYHFDVNATHFEEALDRFAQLFICPLFSAEAISREMHAVDSENSKNLSSDAWRRCQLQKNFSSKDHPYHKFQTGNKTTLHTRPISRGMDIREGLQSFFEENYSAGLMSLAVYGKEPVTKLEELVREKFSLIKNKCVEALRFPGSPCSSEHLKIIVKSVPLRDQNILEVTWPITPNFSNYKKGASPYVQHILESDAEGSLIALLKELGWANSISAQENGTMDYAFLEIYLELTNAGQEHVQEVLDFLFQYVKLLQQEGVVEWIYEEIYPVEDWLATDALFAEFDRNTISALANQLKPQHVRIFCSSKKHKLETTDVEPWYGTPYTVEYIDDICIQRWEDAPIDTRLHLPSPNIFKPTDFNIKNFEGEEKHPVMIRKTSLSKLWYKHGTNFKTPKAYVYLSFHCPESNKSVEAEILTYIFTWLFADEMTEYAYYTSMAGLYYSVSDSKDGLEVVVEGYHDKLMSLTEKIVEKMLNFRMKEDRFAFVKEKVVRNYANMRFMQPHAQANYEINHILTQESWHLSECLEVLPLIDAQKFSAYFPRLLSGTFVEALIGGNVTSSEATSLMQYIEKTLSPLVNNRAPNFSQSLQRRIMCLEAGTEWFYPTAGFSPDDENSAISIFFQVERDSPRSNMLLKLFTLIAQEQYFNQLRTVEQLGYIVNLYEKHFENVRGVQITIQSTVKDPTQLDQRIEAFFTMFEEELQMMTVEEFKNNAEVLMDMKLEKCKNIWEESDFYWREISRGSLQFDRKKNEVNALKELKKEDLIAFFNQKIKRNGSERRKLGVQIFGNQHHRELIKAKDERKLPLSFTNDSENGHSNPGPTETKQNEPHPQTNGSKDTDSYHLLSNGIAETIPRDDFYEHLYTPGNGYKQQGVTEAKFDSRQQNAIFVCDEQAAQLDHTKKTCANRIDDIQAFKRSQSFYCSPKIVP
uniref:Insulin-degrading enzyme-like 1, peroxisomal n=1 Tax=Physcomitrium patens TaxID=3218 RepID=A0A7I4B9I0_PHYPA